MRSQHHYDAINRAFSRQSHHYDEDDAGNNVLKRMRTQVYEHVNQYLQPGSAILELNAGTGIDALYFASRGHKVHATDISDGMISQIRAKANHSPWKENVTYQQLSYDRLNEIEGMRFDHVFSNFGGLNCIENLSDVTVHLRKLLKGNSCVTFVIMPPISLWEWSWIFKGQFSKAFRRLKKNGITAHLEGEYFKTYYHSLSQIRKAFPPEFKLISVEGLCSLSPPPAAKHFVIHHPNVSTMLKNADRFLRYTFPFNRCADHIIVTFKIVP